MKGNLNELILRTASSGLTLQSANGAMPAGHNGLYRDPETPVRNTAHWAMTFLRAFELSDDPKYKTAAIRAVEFLQSKEARPLGFTFWCRSNPKKDSCNGLIGQAWALEPFIYGARLTDNPEWLRFAEEIFLLHPFDEQRGLWMRVNIDGMHLPFDVTFNHQLWFAAAGAQLAHHSEKVQKQTDRFMNQLNRHLAIYSSGLIYHPLLFRYSLKEKKSDILRMLLETKERRKMIRHKAVGYHLFNMYAFSMLYKIYPEHPFWKSTPFKKTVEYAFSDPFADAVSDNEFAFPYNPPGFEIAFMADTFGDQFGNTPDISSWISEQLKRTYNREKGLMNLASEDPATQAARFYEAVRIENRPIEESLYKPES
ncbi:MAG: agl cluster protein AglQ [Balneolaceae bacterium]|nr:MAG: agl cluster protein AglQ [Balneolaceae bacterium]